ncbi:HlyD family type I secretion periplasmic adaptor subunit [Rhabdaerophilum sp. SD176]|uniref:HlyD family type I secretion periplasmic adaptor subunit n=1 Tax=Rhabdaerophilum sp. SD176 TaxID=2983548 RepID=UPI0024DFB242|nr:HlyD family type I secretion periplasmic adaptor subunit [Rhabdaerophilum sp. SD176]
MHKDDFAFANDIRAAADLRTPRTYVLLVRVTAALILSAVIWASLAVLDEVTRGEGRVIPSRQVQVVQPLEGGLVENIHVAEGAIVQKGDVLMRIDDTNFAAQLGEIRERRLALASRVARLTAESTGQSQIGFPPSLLKEAGRATEAERLVFEARQRKLTQDIEVIVQQVGQRRAELGELQAQERRLAQAVDLLSKETAITRRLFQQRVVPEIEMLRLDRQAAEMQGQLDVVKASLAKAEVAILEAEARRDSVTSTFRAASEEELAKVQADLAVVEETIRAAQDRVRRTDLRAPVHGIVNKISVTTIGAVVQPGQAVMDIVPLEDNLLIEANVRPADIAFIRPGQDAVVKISAYDPTVYGSLQGKVERISANTITNDQKEVYYRVVIRTVRSHLGPDAAQLPIIPGMVGSVEILTGRKSVLEYVLRPIRKVFDEALRER